MDRRGTAMDLGLGALLFGLYAAGACPTIYVGDSGELVTAVDVLGIPHPTGYPLYVLLGKLWTLVVPFGSIAWRMSLFSAAFAAATGALLHRLLRRLGAGGVPALTGALLLAAAPSFWGEATVQRVYTLGAFFVVAATAAALRWWQRRDTASVALVFGLAGLGATNHMFMAVWALAFAAFVALEEPGVLRRGRWLAAGGLAFAVGLLPYAYLPLRSRADPPLDWGNPETLERFLDVVTRGDFWQRAWYELPPDVVTIGADWLRSIPAELGWAGAALALLGVLAAGPRRWPVALPLLVMLVNVVALGAHGSRSDLFLWHRYYIPSYAMAALLAGLGTQALLTRLPRWLRLAPLVLPALLVVAGWARFDRSRYTTADAFSRAVLRSLPPSAHLAATDDNILFVLMYLHFVEHERPDVDLILQGVGGADLPALRFDPDTDPLFLTHHPNWPPDVLDVVPVGLVFRAMRPGRPLPPVTMPLERLPGEDDPRVPKDHLTQNLIGHFHYMRGVTLEPRNWMRARREFEAAARAAPDNDVLFYNLGLIYRRNGLLEESLAAFERSAAINPRHLASTRRVRAIDRVTEIRGMLAGQRGQP